MIFSSVIDLSLVFQARRFCTFPFLWIAPCTLANSSFPSCLTIYPCILSGNVSNDIEEITSWRHFAVSTSTCVWPLVNWPFGKACATSKPACVHKVRSFIIWASGGARNTFSNANKVRDWRIYADFAQSLIQIARPMYGEEDLAMELDNTVYALDSSTIDLCLSVFPWALFRSTKSAVKLHTLLDLRGNIPTFIHISEGKLHDVNVLDILVPEAGAFYIMDRGYLDF